jgi:hypothetical protein
MNDEDAEAASLIADHEARIAALERLVGRQVRIERNRSADPAFGRGAADAVHAMDELNSLLPMPISWPSPVR